MDKNVLISIVTACYNQGHFIKNAIKSIVKQTHTNWELIIVDDNSTDSSLGEIKKIVKKYNIENKTKIFKNDENKGYGVSLDRGIRESSGELIAVVDADDALAEKDALKIERDVHIKRPDAALVYSNYIECDAQLKPKRTYKTRALKENEQYLGTKIRISHFKMFKKKCYEMTAGINPKLRQCVDKDLNLRLEEVGKLVYVDADLMYYRIHSDNLSLTTHRKGAKYKKFVDDMRKQIYIDAGKRRACGSDRGQLKVWHDSNNCKRLQKRFGDYDAYKKNMGNKHNINKVAIFELMYKIFKDYDEKATLLEVGCGPGHFLWSFKDHVSKLIGLDYSPYMIELAKKQLNKTDVESEFINASCWDIPLSDGSIDIVLQVDVCMHIGGSWDSIKEMIRVSRKHVVFTGPSFENFSDVMDKQIGKISWAVSIPLLKRELDSLLLAGKIKEYSFLERPVSEVYNHKILFIKK